MAEFTGTFKTNEDHSISLPLGENNVPIRYVKESDLLTVKGGAETKATEWGTKEAKFNTDLAEANRLREESHQALLEAQAKGEQLTTQVANYDTVKTKVGELETEIGSHKESVEKLQTELVSRIRLNLIGNGATEEALTEKTLDQLRNLEEAARILGNNGKGGKVPALANYAGGSGGPGGGSTNKTEFEIAQAEIEEHNTKGTHKMGAK